MGLPGSSSKAEQSQEMMQAAGQPFGDRQTCWRGDG